MSKKGKSIETETDEWWLPGGWRGGWGVIAMVIRFPLGVIKMF